MQDNLRRWSRIAAYSVVGTRCSLILATRVSRNARQRAIASGLLYAWSRVALANDITSTVAKPAPTLLYDLSQAVTA
jgi:hypothetical protein